MPRLSHDSAELVPVVAFDGPTLDFDFPGLEIGVAEYDEGPTGCTVFHFPDGADCSTDVRGGSPGTTGDAYPYVDAICLAGGSIYGLEAVAGVNAELLARRDYRTGAGHPARRRFDHLRLGPTRPDVFPLGKRGAGRSATVGKLFAYEQGEAAGQGGAFRQVGDTKVAVFVVVNAVGAIVNREGEVVLGRYDRASGIRRGLVDGLEGRLAEGQPVRPPPPGNTTLTVVATNLTLDARQLRTLARQTHVSMARAIQPFHALEDGDVLYAVSTGQVEKDPLLDTTGLGVVASEVAWDAVLSIATAVTG